MGNDTVFNWVWSVFVDEVYCEYNLFLIAFLLVVNIVGMNCFEIENITSFRSISDEIKLCARLF